MDYLAGGFLYGSLDFLMLIMLWTRYYKYKKSFSKSQYPKCPQNNQLEDGCYSIVQPTTFTINNIQNTVGMLIFGFLMVKMITTQTHNILGFVQTFETSTIG